MNVFFTPDHHHSDQPGFVFYLLLFYFVLQAAFIYGSIFYAKFSLIKTVISLLLIGLFSAFIIGKVYYRHFASRKLSQGYYQLYDIHRKANRWRRRYDI